jgi:uncharacterized membrane protein YbaN (DUF454 family)
MDIGIRLLWILLGLTCVVLGAIGVVVPLLPTTPFLLVAAFAFARSSARLTHWLHEQRTFGPLIRNWQQYGSIDRKSKLVSIVVIVLSPVITLMFDAPWWAIGSQILVLSFPAAFILTRPLPPETNAQGEEPVPLTDRE